MPGGLRCRSCGCGTGEANVAGDKCPGPLGAGGVCRCHIPRHLWPEAPKPDTAATLLTELAEERARVVTLAEALDVATQQLDEARELADHARLLGPARMALDLAAVGPTDLHPEAAIRQECATVAQLIVDLIGHPVTDEPPHALVERDQLRAEVSRLIGVASAVPPGGWVGPPWRAPGW